MDWETGFKRGPFSDEQAKDFNKLFSELNGSQFQWLHGFLTGIDPLFQNTTSFTELKSAQADLKQTNSISADPIWILYGTHTGNSEGLAKKSAKAIADLGFETKIANMGSFKVREFKTIKKLLVIVSTHGLGDPPPEAEELHAFLHSSRAPELKHIDFSVLALGDSSYTEFCDAGRQFDEILEKLGGNRITNRVECDVDYEDSYTVWLQEVISKLTANKGIAVQDSIKQEPTLKIETVYNRKNPFPATILNKINLNGRNSGKETIHLELDLKGSELHYEPGDALGIYAINSKRLIDGILTLCKLTGEEKVQTHHGYKSLFNALSDDYELTPLTSLSLKHYAELTGSDRLKKIISNNSSIAEYIHGRDIYDLLQEVPYKLSPDNLIAILRKNTPRMYSIASSQEAVNDEVHVVVSVVRYEGYGRYKEGFCSSFLSDRIHTDEQVKVFIDPNTRFKLPTDQDSPIIMVGAGTGIAPYRSFMQQRELTDSHGKSWLFFGERNFTTDFLYQSEWLQYIKDGVLTKADVAFSRDQERKIYVQHKMIEKGKELFNWLESGAHFYVCGDAQHMAKDVDFALKNIIQTHGGLTKDKADEYVKALQQSNRYQTDIY
jgi:sulfite reductase (NADPH) flavoprotein alpha-component